MLFPKATCYFSAFFCVSLSIVLSSCNQNEMENEKNDEQTENVDFAETMNKIHVHVQALTGVDPDMTNAALLALLKPIDQLFKSVPNDEIPSSVAAEFKEARNKFNAGFKLISVEKDQKLNDVDAFSSLTLFVEAWQRCVEKAIDEGFDLDIKNMPQDQKSDAKHSATKVSIAALEMACDAFKLDTGTYPKSLKDLTIKPTETERNWRGPYVNAKDMDYLKDPWGTEFRYSADEENSQVYIRSAGPDCKFETNDDIVSE